MAASAPTADRWLFGPIPDLLLGCGGLYVLVLLTFAIGGADLRAVEAVWLGPLLVLLLGAPHYGATLLRVYEHRADRRAYWIFSVYATLAVSAWFLGGLWSGFLASALVTVYLTWSPWHYTGQNYGLAILFARRRGITVAPMTKRLLYASFVLSYALTFLAFHGDIGSAPTPEFASGPRNLFRPIGIPFALLRVLFPLTLLAYLGVLAAAAWRLVGAASIRDATPTLILAASQALWFSIPVAIKHWSVSVSVDPLRWELRDYYFFWIALGHSTQYLWVTSYYARASGERIGFSRYFAKILVVGTALWTIPVVALDPLWVGFLPNSAALALLAAAAINIHHFILDGAIWKLRDSRIASVLIRRDARPAGSPAPGDPTPRWGRRAVWSVAAIGAGLALFKYANQDVLFPMAVARGEFAVARAAMDRLGWISHISTEARRSLDAVEAQQRAATLRGSDRRLRRVGPAPRLSGHLARARQFERAGDWGAALEQYRAALAIDAGDPSALRGAGQALLVLGRPDEAVALFEKLVEVAPGDESAKRQLQRSRERTATSGRGY